MLTRYSFRKNKSGTRWSSDNITISCFVWDKRHSNQKILIRPKSKILGFYKNPEQAIPGTQIKSIIYSIAQLYDSSTLYPIQ